MSIPRYSREDMADTVRCLTESADQATARRGLYGRYVTVNADMLRAAAAALSEAANRTPTHKELVELIERERIHTASEETRE